MELLDPSGATPIEIDAELGMGTDLLAAAFGELILPSCSKPLAPPWGLRRSRFVDRATDRKIWHPDAPSSRRLDLLTTPYDQRDDGFFHNKEMGENDHLMRVQVEPRRPLLKR